MKLILPLACIGLLYWLAIQTPVEKGYSQADRDAFNALYANAIHPKRSTRSNELLQRQARALQDVFYIKDEEIDKKVNLW